MRIISHWSLNINQYPSPNPVYLGTIQVPLGGKLRNTSFTFINSLSEETCKTKYRVWTWICKGSLCSFFSTPHSNFQRESCVAIPRDAESGNFSSRKFPRKIFQKGKWSIQRLWILICITFCKIYLHSSCLVADLFVYNLFKGSFCLFKRSVSEKRWKALNERMFSTRSEWKNKWPCWGVYHPYTFD